MMNSSAIIVFQPTTFSVFKKDEGEMRLNNYLLQRMAQYMAGNDILAIFPSPAKVSMRWNQVRRDNGPAEDSEVYNRYYQSGQNLLRMWLGKAVSDANAKYWRSSDGISGARLFPVDSHDDFKAFAGEYTKRSMERPSLWAVMPGPRNGVRKQDLTVACAKSLGVRTIVNLRSPQQIKQISSESSGVYRQDSYYEEIKERDGISDALDGDVNIGYATTHTKTLTAMINGFNFKDSEGGVLFKCAAELAAQQEMLENSQNDFAIDAASG